MKNLLLFITALLMLCSNGYSQKAKDIHKINFDKIKYPVLSGLSQRDLTTEKTVFGDLDGDGRDEAAVKVLWSFARYGGNGYGYYVYVYKLRNGVLSLLSKMEGGSKEQQFILKDISIKDFLFKVIRCEADAKFDKFFLATILYKWSKTKLVEVQKKRQSVAEQCYLD